MQLEETTVLLGGRALAKWLARLCRMDRVEQIRARGLHIHRDREEQAKLNNF